MVILVAAGQQSHRIPYLKFTFLLIFVLNYQIQEGNETCREYFQRDLNFCRTCFQHEVLNCQGFFDNIVHDSSTSPCQSLINLLPNNGKRKTNFFRYSNNSKSPKIIAKHLTQQKLNSVPKSSKVAILKEKFFASERLDGMQFCPANNIQRFIKYFEDHTKHNALTLWLHLTLNSELILMPHLEGLGYPIPEHFAVCGLTLYQLYAGKALTYFYNVDFELKLRIAKELLEAAIRFSKGFAGFRIYITDLSPDNVVFDENTRKLYFVDLDTVLIVDSHAPQLKGTSIHKHTHIDCDNCFAYSQQDICNYGLSDINLYSACQLLRENLNRKRNGGFLYPMPTDIAKKYPNFERLLENCVDCANEGCANRFAATIELIELFNVILKDFY